MTKTVLVVSDLHCGSVFGMLPPDFEKSDESVANQNPGQAYLWEHWQEMCVWAKATEIAAVVVNGDIVDGRQQAQRGTELALPIIEDQSRAAEEVLRTLKKATPGAPWYFIQGTEYHDARAGREVEVVARQLGTRYHGLGTGIYCKEVLDLNVDGAILNFAHGTSVASGFYRATPADREGIWSALAGKEGKMPKADAVIRAHAHSFVHVEHASKHIMIGPCWQLQTRFMRKNSVYRMIPDVGFIWLVVDGAAKKDGDDPVTVHKRLFPLPKLKATVL